MHIYCKHRKRFSIKNAQLLKHRITVLCTEGVNSWYKMHCHVMLCYNIYLPVTNDRIVNQFCTCSIFSQASLHRHIVFRICRPLLRYRMTNKQWFTQIKEREEAPFVKFKDWRFIQNFDLLRHENEENPKL